MDPHWTPPTAGSCGTSVDGPDAAGVNARSSFRNALLQSMTWLRPGAACRSLPNQASAVEGDQTLIQKKPAAPPTR
jgi:hypothetical protein